MNRTGGASGRFWGGENDGVVIDAGGEVIDGRRLGDEDNAEDS